MQRMIGHRLFLGECPMSDSLNQSERYRALAEEYLRLAATSSSTEIRDRYLRMARITAGWLSPKNQADRPTTISRQAMATENANNARPARTSTVTGRSPKPWRIVEIQNGFADVVSASRDGTRELGAQGMARRVEPIPFRLIGQGWD